MATIRSVMLEQVNAATNTYKAYRIDLVEEGGLYGVTCWNGRIGSPLKPAKVALAPQADEAKAQAAFDKVLKGQIAKTYTPVGEGGPEMVAAAGKTRDPGLLPSLPSAFTLEDVAALDPRSWLVQRKHDGENRPVRIAGGVLSLANRKGIEVPARADLAEALLKLGARTGDVRFDSEDMGPDGLVVFDVVEGLGVTRDTGFGGRNAALARLDEIVAGEGLEKFIQVDVAVPLRDFLDGDMVGALRSVKAEGFVLKHRDAAYVPGRINSVSKATSLKVKFVEDATFRVAAGRDETRASVGIESWDGDAQEWVGMGNVTVPANAARPAPGTFIDVTYLYAFKGGAVFQPVFKGLRTDVSAEDCAIGKLKFKDAPRVEMEDEGMEP